MTQIDALMQEIEQSGLFDEDWYLDTYLDVARVDIDPLGHFVRFGLLMGRDPGPQFDTRFYSQQNPDVIQAGMNPLQHYIRHGRAEGRAGCPAGRDRQDQIPPVHVPDEVTAPRSRPADAAWAWRLGIDAFMLRGLRPMAPLAVAVNAPTRTDWQALLDRVAVTDLPGGIDLFVLGPVTRLSFQNLPDAIRSVTHLGPPDEPHNAKGFLRFAASGCADDYTALLWLSPRDGASNAEIDRAFDRLPGPAQTGHWGCIGSEILALEDLGGPPLVATVKTAMPRIGLQVGDDRLRGVTGAAIWIHPLLLRGLGVCLYQSELTAVPGQAFSGRLSVLAVLSQLALESDLTLETPDTASPSPTPAQAIQRDLKAVAFYLPQFHPIPENDTWWGKGFTEWTNVSRGKSLFRHHYQPRRPADLGYYDLRLEDTQVAQADLAHDFGLHGFCYYYYWFNGKKLLNHPIEQMARSNRIDTGFCVCWANENWSRNWDGQNRHVLMQQDYSLDSNLDLIRELIPMMKDPRWIRYGGKPVMVVYRISIIPNWLETARLWREECRKAGLGEIHLCAVRFGLETLQGQPENHGLDSYVLFPPHEAARKDIRDKALDLHGNFNGEIFDYSAVIDGDLDKYRDGYDWPVHRGTMLAWDNTARRLTDARIFHGATPYGFRRWVRSVLDQDSRHNPGPETLMFINAWNEWAEGTYLEPDQQWGKANLAAIRSAVETVPGLRPVTVPKGTAAAPKLPARLAQAGQPLTSAGDGPAYPVWHGGLRPHNPDQRTIMLCAHVSGHQLFGGERSLLDMLTAFGQMPVNVVVTLPSGNNPDYLAEIAKHCMGAYVFAYPQWMRNREAHGWLTNTFADLMVRHRVDVLHANTIVLLEPLEAAERLGITRVVHVRELISLDEPLRRSMGQETSQIVARVFENTDWVIGNSARTCQLFSKSDRTCYVPNAVALEQFEMGNVFGNGIKFGIVSSNIPKKGVADFVEVARRAAERAPRARFVVIGPENDQTRAWAEEVRQGTRPDNLAFLGYRDTPRAAMSELNVLLNLSSFAESFGRTVAEAMAAQRPVIAYDWGALPELVSHGETGLLVPFRDIDGVVAAVETLCTDSDLIQKMGTAGLDRVGTSFSQPVLNAAMADTYRRIWGPDYPDGTPPGTALSPLDAVPVVPRTTIIVPVYNAPDEVRDCLQSVIKHTDLRHARVIVIDDGSPDPAVQPILAEFADIPELTLERNDPNIGYTRTVNRGLDLAGNDDVVLLNSDTYVTPRWLEGLRTAAYCRDSVGTVTAMSDNAGAFSFPDFNAYCPRPDHISREEYAILLTEATQHCMPPQVPTGSGFCMYVRRAMVEACGAFDHEGFPKGYGEENDFCMRGLKAGWAHLISPWSFVYHVRTASFKSAKDALVKAGVDVVTARYPDYASLVKAAFAAPEMTDLRAAARTALAANLDGV